MSEQHERFIEQLKHHLDMELPSHHTHVQKHGRCIHTWVEAERHRIPSWVQIDDLLVEEATNLYYLVREVVAFMVKNQAHHMNAPCRFMRPDAMARYHYAMERALNTGERFTMRYGYELGIDIAGPQSRLQNAPGVGISARPQVTAGWQPYLHDHEY